MASGGGLTRTEPLMGTDLTITVFDSQFETAVVDEAFRWLHWVDETFSTFREDSEISRIGRGELDTDDASSDVRYVLARCDELEVASEKRFSIRPGRSGGPGLDPSGFVKGWSVDEAALVLRVGGAGRFIIDAGGDVLCVGRSPTGSGWRIGIRNPGQPENVGAVLSIPEGAAATSGTYFRGEHIWGEATSEKTITSVTVVGPSLGLADALATAIYSDQAASLAWVSRFPEYGVALMTSDNQLRWTSHLDGMIDDPGTGG